MNGLTVITDDPALARCLEGFCATCGAPLDPEGYHADVDAARWTRDRGQTQGWCGERCTANYCP